MKTARTVDGMTDSKTTNASPRLYLVRLESEAENSPDTHDLFIETEETETERRAAFVAQLKARVQAGTYQPNLALIAERMLADK